MKTRQMESIKLEELKWHERSSLNAAVLAIAALSVMILEIVFIGTWETTLATTLFGVLQFIFSLGFAWVLSKERSKREFQDSQRSFAIAAFRRVREIERAVSRLLLRIGARKSEDCSSELERELDITHEVAIGILETARSSIGDWADVIGDEILETIAEVDALRIEKLEVSPAARIQPPKTGSLEERMIKELAVYRQSLDERLEQLLEKLPASLRIGESQQYDQPHLSPRRFKAILDHIRSGKQFELYAYTKQESGPAGRMSRGDRLYFKGLGSKEGSASIRVTDHRDTPLGRLFHVIKLSGDRIVPLPHKLFRRAMIEALVDSGYEAEFLSIDRRDADGSVDFRILVRPQAVAKRTGAA